MSTINPYQLPKCTLELKLTNFKEFVNCNLLALKKRAIKKRAYGQQIHKIEHVSFTLWLCRPLVDWLTRQLTFINTVLLYCLVSGGWILSSNGLVEMFLVRFLVTISFSMCPWCSFLDSTLRCGSSANGLSKGGVQFILEDDHER